MKGRDLYKKLRVVIVGAAAAGKTTIVKKLVGDRWMGSELKHYEELYAGWNPKEVNEGKKKKRKGVTDGIDVHQWVPEGSEVEISLWNFAGQEVYYTTHQFFISPGSLFIIVFNCCKPLRDAKILYWLNSIQSRVKNQKVLIIATHVDQIKPAKRTEILQSLSNYISEVYKRWVYNYPTTDEVISIIQNKSEKLLFWPMGKSDVEEKLK